MTNLIVLLAILATSLGGCASKRPADAGASARVPAQMREADDASPYLSCVYYAGFLGLPQAGGVAKCDRQKPAVLTQATFGAKELRAQRYYLCLFDAGSRQLAPEEAAAACAPLRPPELGPLAPYGT